MISLETVYYVLRDNALILIFVGFFSFMGVYLGFIFGCKDQLESFADKVLKLSETYDKKLNNERDQIREEFNERLKKTIENKNEKIEKLNTELTNKKTEISMQQIQTNQLLAENKFQHENEINKLKLQSEKEKDKLFQLHYAETSQKDKVVQGRDGENNRLYEQRNELRTALMLACNDNQEMYDAYLKQAKAIEKSKRCLQRIKPKAKL